MCLRADVCGSMVKRRYLGREWSQGASNVTFSIQIYVSLDLNLLNTQRSKIQTKGSCLCGPSFSPGEKHSSKTRRRKRHTDNVWTFVGKLIWTTFLPKISFLLEACGSAVYDHSKSVRETCPPMFLLFFRPVKIDDFWLSTPATPRYTLLACSRMRQEQAVNRCQSNILTEDQLERSGNEITTSRCRNCFSSFTNISYFRLAQDPWT